MATPRYVRATVSGEAPIRDVLTRESVEPGGRVVLLVREVGATWPRCPRHPKSGRQSVYRPEQRCLCGGTVVEWLEQQGAISDVQPYDPDKPEAKPAEPAVKKA